MLNYIKKVLNDLGIFPPKLNIKIMFIFDVTKINIIFLSVSVDLAEIFCRS